MIRALAIVVAALPAAALDLVPATPAATPDYFCTWNVQGFAACYSNANAQADALNEANLFGRGTNAGWASFFPEVRGDLIFLLDDACDFPPGGGRNHPARGSIELDTTRFPSCEGSPEERLTKLNRDLQARGWRGLGLWICNSRNRLPGQEQIESDAYWCERLGWSQRAGVRYWKVDWGIGDRDKPLWKFKMTPRAKAAAPDLWIEFGNSTDADVYRTYDVAIVQSIPETLRRIGAFLEKRDPKDRRLINCEDEVYLGAALGCHYGIMRHPLTGPMADGKPDGFFPEHFRDVKRRMDEVTRAVRWHRFASPFPRDDAALVDAQTLTDQKAKPAPARIARGGLALPEVGMPDGGEPPYVVCARHPGGEVALATAPRHLAIGGRSRLVFPRADVTLAVGALDRPVAVFGVYASVTLRTTVPWAGHRLLAQDLAGHTAVDITGDVTVRDGAVTIPGAVLERVGLMAAKPGDVSDPGLVLAVEGLTDLAAAPPMRPPR